MDSRLRGKSFPAMPGMTFWATIAASACISRRFQMSINRGQSRIVLKLSITET
jgi:hypothetical protein